MLSELGAGEVIQGTGGYTVERVTVTDFAVTVSTREVKPRDAYNQKGFILRENVDIGETRIRNVSIVPPWDQLLREAIGQEVALSVVGPEPGSFTRHTVLALRSAREGVVRPSKPILIYGTLRTFIKYWLLAPLAFVLLLIPAFIVGKIFAPLGYLGFAVAIIGLLYYIVVPFLMVRRTLAATAALGSNAGAARAQLQA